jgi:hypothetical protein
MTAASSSLKVQSLNGRHAGWMQGTNGHILKHGQPLGVRRYPVRCNEKLCPWPQLSSELSPYVGYKPCPARCTGVYGWGDCAYSQGSNLYWQIAQIMHSGCLLCSASSVLHTVPLWLAGQIIPLGPGDWTVNHCMCHGPLIDR